MSTQMQTTNGRRGHEDGPQETNATTRTALGDQMTTGTGETAALAVAERSKAIVQAKIMQAIARPRAFEIVRERLMGDCDRPRFAEASRYSRPQGWVIDEETGRPVTVNGEKVRNFITGWSIRFVEAALQALGNIECSAVALYEDDRKKVIRVEVWDLERNLQYAKEITIEKSIERKFLKAGQKPLGSRPNSYGDTVYLLPATDDDTRLKENRLVSMTLRQLGLRCVPGDLLDEALERVEISRVKAAEAARAGITADPKKAMRDFLDKMAKIGIRAADIIEYLGGRSLDAATPDQIMELRIIGAGVISGDMTWRDALDGSPYRQRDDAEGTPETDAAKVAREKIEKTLAEQKKKAKPKATPGDAPPQGAQAPEARPTPPAVAVPTEHQPGDAD